MFCTAVVWSARAARKPPNDAPGQVFDDDSRKLMRIWLVAASLGLGAISVCAQSTTVASDEPAEWIVFSSARSGNGDIYALDPDSGKLIEIVSTDLPEGAPRFDAANSRIVHQRYEDRRTILVSGSDDLFRDPSSENAPAWSPDGWWIAYSDVRNGSEDLFIARPDGSGERQLTDDPEIDRYPSWSPDGTRIIFSRKEDTGWVLCTLDLRDLTGGLERLTSPSEYVGHPAWSPDDTRVAFDMLFDGQAEIAILDLVSRKLTRLTDRPGNDLVPAWSTDGRMLAFGGQPDSTLNWDIWRIGVENLELTRLTTDPAFDGGPIFVPAAAIGNEK